ncbi:hypothetical protein J2X75_001568 [Paenibacillus sp. 2003]|nr:hypothetical protein [Paenibacillus sp. 2003]
MISGCNEAKNKNIVPLKVAILAAFFCYQGPNSCFKLIKLLLESNVIIVRLKIT